MIDIIGNRATKLFQRASELIATNRSTLLIYWDTYAGQIPEHDAKAYDRVLRPLPRSVTNPFDDKGRLGEMLHQQSELFPVTFSNLNSIPDSLADPDSLWFKKNRHSAGGKQVECVRLGGLEASSLGRDDVLQQAVTDLRLIGNRKYTIRAYVLVWNGGMFLYDKWYRVIHSGHYSADSTDYGVQVSLRYDGGGTEFSPQSEDSSSAEFAALEEINQKLLPAFTPLFGESDNNTFIILGCDYLIRQSGAALLIEVNAYPNLMHLDASVADKVIFPMINDSLAMMVTEKPCPTWTSI